MRHKQAKPIKVSSKYRLYSPAALTNAFLAIKDNGWAVNKAARQFNVPETTLRQRVNGEVHVDSTHSGPPPLLSQEQESHIVDHLKCMADMGYGYTRSEITTLASDVLVGLGKRAAADKPLSLKWFYGFMGRWPELHVQKPRSLSHYRAKATSAETVSSYFAELKCIMDKYNLHDFPQHIYNVDEKGIKQEHTPPYVVAASGRAPPAITANKGSTTTVIGAGNALGSVVPPYFVFCGQRMRSELMAGATAGADGTVSDSGWSNSQIFESYIKNHFLKYVQGRDPEQHIIVLYDGHASHVSIPLIEWARENKIILFVLPAHTSHVLQPMDVSCFGPFEKIFNSQCHTFIRNTPNSVINRYNVCELACKAYSVALSPENLRSAFRKTGIYPFNANCLDESVYAPSVPFLTPQTVSSNTAPPDVDSDSCDVVKNILDKKKTAVTNKGEENKKPRKSMSKLTSGKAITEDKSYESLTNYQESSKRKAVPEKSKNKQISKKSKSAESVKSSSKQQVKVTPPPTASTSGLKKGKLLVTEDEDSDASTIISSSDEEVCCVCGKFQPAEIKQCVSLVFTKWAHCDFEGCDHWTHLKYCCPTKVIRLNERFVCPHH